MADTAPVKMLGKADKKYDSRNLMASAYLASTFPASYDWQKRRTAMPARTFGNTSYGDCTLASQANGVARLERMEQRRTVLLPDQTVISNYLDMTGGADEGWYELDALKRWRTKGFSLSANRTYTIDGFAEVNTRNVDEIKAALAQFKVIKICFMLPLAWRNIDPKDYVSPGNVAGAWDTGTSIDFEVGSWGGHSMLADAYDQDGIKVVHSWFYGAKPARQLVTWDAVTKYSDEAYSIVDSFDFWRKRAAYDLTSLRADVAQVVAQ